jgi:hypothetical protein
MNGNGNEMKWGRQTGEGGSRSARPRVVKGVSEQLVMSSRVRFNASTDNIDNKPCTDAHTPTSWPANSVRSSGTPLSRTTRRLPDMLRDFEAMGRLFYGILVTSSPTAIPPT